MIKAVVFDAFGTLVEIKKKTWPYHSLINAIKESLPYSGDFNKSVVMMQRTALRDWPEMAGTSIDPAVIEQAERSLKTELESIELFDDVEPTMQALKSKGLKLALCSNLALPYAEPVRRLLPVELDVYGWSFEIGAVKPYPEIYRWMCEALAIAPSEALFVGDNGEADYAGPTEFGMQARFLDRAAKEAGPHVIYSLREILETVD